MMVTLSDSAIEVLKDMLEDRGPDENALRIYVKPGGCSGFSYGMALDGVHENDTVFEVHGLQVVVDNNSMEFVSGSQVDYVDDLSGRGFRISNPNAVSTCGCGSSFRTETNAGQPGSCD